jgi:hypothetical protein
MQAGSALPRRRRRGARLPRPARGAAEAAGIATERIASIPASASARRLEHNLELLRRLGEVPGARLGAACWRVLAQVHARRDHRPKSRRETASVAAALLAARGESCACMMWRRRGRAGRMVGGRRSGVSMGRKYFGTDGVRGTRGRGADHAGFRHAPGLCRRHHPGRRASISRRGNASGRADRQGHAHFRLHAGSGAGGRVRRGRGGRHADRADADAGHRLPHPRAAPAGRRGDLRLAQSLSTTTASSSSPPAAPSCRTRWRRTSRRAWSSRWAAPRRPARQGAPGRRRGRPLHRILQEHLPQRARPARPEDRGRLRPRCGLSHRAQGVP